MSWKARATPAGPPGGVGGQGRLREGKNPFEDLTFITAVNEMANRDFGLFCNYQINPYTKKTREYLNYYSSYRITD